MRGVEDADQSVGAAREEVLRLERAVSEGVNRAFERTSVLKVRKRMKAKRVFEYHCAHRERCCGAWEISTAFHYSVERWKVEDRRWKIEGGRSKVEDRRRKADAFENLQRVVSCDHQG